MSIEQTGLTCAALVASMGDHLRSRGYLQLPARGLVSTAFTDTFAPSAFHEDIVSRVRHGPEGGEGGDRRAGVDWVFRHVDLDKAADSPWHLSCFQMGVFFTASRRRADDSDLREAVVTLFVETLGELGLPVRASIVTYFGGGRIRGRDLPADDEVVDFWRCCGLREEQLIPVRGRACFTNCERTGEPAGPRCEVFIPAADGRMVEVGTVVFERFVIGSGPDLIESEGLVYGGALGIERVAMLRKGVLDLAEIPDVEPTLKLVRSSIGTRLATVCHQQVRGLVDGLRSLVLIRGQMASLDRKREQRLRTVVRRVHRYLVDLGIEEPGAAVVSSACLDIARRVHVHDSVVDVVLQDLCGHSDKENERGLARKGQWLSLSNNGIQLTALRAAADARR